DLAERELVAQPHAPDLANHVHGDHLESLLKFSAGQWNTLVNIGLALCGLAGQDCIGTNTWPMALMIGRLNGRYKQKSAPEGAFLLTYWRKRRDSNPR
ncbi:hypothetical protein, partial [Acidovorax sp. NB1]|uniref:hypothetical protein n=1 Tax=Acidovorax sp. NB1 TaxID=1943571 RepID=UPI001BB2AC0B